MTIAIDVLEQLRATPSRALGAASHLAWWLQWHTRPSPAMGTRPRTGGSQHPSQARIDLVGAAVAGSGLNSSSGAHRLMRRYTVVDAPGRARTKISTM